MALCSQYIGFCFGLMIRVYKCLSVPGGAVLSKSSNDLLFRNAAFLFQNFNKYMQYYEQAFKLEPYRLEGVVHHVVVGREHVCHKW